MDVNGCNRPPSYSLLVGQDKSTQDAKGVMNSPPKPENEVGATIHPSEADW